MTFMNFNHQTSVHWAETDYGLSAGQHAVLPEGKGTTRHVAWLTNLSKTFWNYFAVVLMTAYPESPCLTLPLHHIPAFIKWILKY